jgi:hypothetical protein
VLSIPYLTSPPILTRTRSLVTILVMCTHPLFIYTICGHSFFCPHPLTICHHASIPPTSTHSTHCVIVAHPFRSWKLHSLCSNCTSTRQSMLGQIEQRQALKFDERKWRVAYQLPENGGKDYWTRKMEEKREEEERVKRREGGKGRFSWRRKSGNCAGEK